MPMRLKPPKSNIGDLHQESREVIETRLFLKQSSEKNF
jgi:hypothetical protein